MKKILTLSVLCLLFLFQYCGTAKKAQAINAVSYNQDVHPIIMNSCSPCHTGGKQKSLNNYAAASGEIDEILTLIQKNPGEKRFMTFRHDKLPDSTIAVFVRWKEAGTPESN